jgi:serine/threonine protein kinase
MTTPLTSDHRPTAPRKIGPYLIHEAIASGSTAIVARGECVATGQVVALKIVNMKVSSQIATDVLKEIKILNRVSHPNIIRTYGMVRSVPEVVIAMEIGCQALVDWVVSERNHSMLTILEIFHPICLAVKYLHSQNIAHGDLKLDNIILDKLQRPKLIDFGHAHTARYNYGPKRGTMAYAAPELFQEKAVDTHAVDVWALGIVLFAMITGDFPYPTSTRDFVAWIEEGALDYAAVTDLEVQRLIMKMTRVEPTDRLTISEVVIRVADLMKDH